MPAASSEGLHNSASRAEVMSAVLRSKGMRGMDDLEAEGEPLLTLQAHHELVVVVELCCATRPSKLGSLKGSHAKYEEQFMRMEDVLGQVAEGGQLSVQKWEPPAGAALESSRPARPQSAQLYARMQGLGATGAEERVAPRIGAFEVSCHLRNTTSGTTYPSLSLFSKLESGCWPGSGTRMVNKARQDLQPYLEKDIGHQALHTHVSAQIEQQGGSPSRR